MIDGPHDIDLARPENPKGNRIRLDVLSSTKAVALLTTLYSLGVIILSSVGTTGPSVFQHIGAQEQAVMGASRWAATDASCQSQCTFRKTIHLNHMRSEMQLVYMKIDILRPEQAPGPAESFSVSTRTVVIGCAGSCAPTAPNYSGKEIQDISDIKPVEFENNELFSSAISLFTTDPAPVSYDRYNVTVTLADIDGLAARYYDDGVSQPSLLARVNMITVDPSFTWWVMGWKVVFQIGTLVAAFSPITCKGGIIAGFFVQQRNLKWKDWSSTQAWVGFLLIILFFFNDPFFPLQFYGSISEDAKTFLVMQQIIFVAVFISSLLCFMLSSTGTIISSNKEQFQAIDPKFKSNVIILKVGLCCIIFAFLFFYYIIARLYNTGSPEYDDFAENSVYFSFEVLLGVLMAVFSLWYTADIIKCLTRVRLMEKAYLALLVVCVLAAVMMVIGISIGALYVLPDEAFKWMFFYGTANITVWVVSWSFAHAEEPDTDDGLWELSGSKEGYASLLGQQGFEPLGGGEGVLGGDEDGDFQ